MGGVRWAIAAHIWQPPEVISWKRLQELGQQVLDRAERRNAISIIAFWSVILGGSGLLVLAKILGLLAGMPVTIAGLAFAAPALVAGLAAFWFGSRLRFWAEFLNPKQDGLGVLMADLERSIMSGKPKP